MTEDRPDLRNDKEMLREDALKAMAAGQEFGYEPTVVDHEVHTDVGDPDAAQPFHAVHTPARTSAPKAANAHNFKKLMIPLLIVVGGLLLLLGGAVAFLDATGSLAGASEFGDGSLRTVLVYSAFPLGIILLAGAWLFHREVRQPHKPSGHRSSEDVANL